MDEQKLVAALINDRSAYDELAGKLDPADFSEQGEAILRAGVGQYKRDPSAMAVDRDVLESAIRRMFANEKHADNVIHWLADLPSDVSSRNVAAEYRLLRRERVGFDLAAKLGAGEHDESVQALIEKYQELSREGTAEKDRPSIDDLYEDIAGGARMRLYPAGVNRACRGGCLPGHNITVFARPNAGKTLLAINMAAGFLRDGRRVLYTGNEEPINDLVLRMLARLSGLPLSRLYESKELGTKAERKAGELYERFFPKQTTSGTIGEVEALVRKYQPDVVVIDQLKNLKIGSGNSNRALELDQIARAIRDLGKQNHIVTVGLTQAADSADQKMKLGMGDVEFSNTGVPGAADLMIGLGVNDKWQAQGRRMINLPKNKIGGQHVSFPVFIDDEKQLIRTRRSNND